MGTRRSGGSAATRSTATAALSAAGVRDFFFLRGRRVDGVTHRPIPAQHVVALTVGAAARRKRLAKQNKRAPAADAPARELLAALNADAAAWLRGAGPLPAALGASESSPVWSRAYSHPAGAEPAQSRCGEAAKALDALGLRRMVVGHTPQITAGINACCGGRVYRIDTGLSSFYGGMKQCLEVVSNARPRVISSTPEYFW